jgi:hypothetical protein
MRAFYALAASAALVSADSPVADDDNNSAESYKCERNMSCFNPLYTTYLMSQMTQYGRSSNNARTVDLREIIKSAMASTEASSDDQPGPDEQPSGRFGAKIPIHLVANYGCWCYGGSQWPTNEGRSKPRDPHDDACKAHAMGMKCIITDAKYENKDCDPYTTNYDVTITQDGYGALLMECSDSIAEDWCRRRTCMVELRLLARYWKLMDTGVWPEYSKWAHPNIGGKFDPMIECPPKGGVGSDIEMRCCGDYPYRSYYFAKVEDQESGKQQCCVYQDADINDKYGFAINIGQTYNQFEKTCTENGPV